MKKLLFLIPLIAVLFLSCEDFATRHSLPKEMSKSLTVEILDRSRIMTTTGAVTYMNMQLSNPGWAEYMLNEAKVHVPGVTDVLNPKLTATKYQNNVIVTEAVIYSTLVAQGEYKIIYELDDKGLFNEKKTYPFTINVDGTGKDFLSVRSTSKYSERAPYICEKECEFSINFSRLTDDNKVVYIKAYEPDGFDTVYTNIYDEGNNNKLLYSIKLVKDDFKQNKWLKIPLSKMEIPNSSVTKSMDYIKSNTYSRSYAYCTKQETWGNLLRSQYRAISETNSSINDADIIDLPPAAKSAGGSRSLNQPEVKSILYEKIMNGEIE